MWVKMQTYISNQKDWNFLKSVSLVSTAKLKPPQLNVVFLGHEAAPRPTRPDCAIPAALDSRRP